MGLARWRVGNGKCIQILDQPWLLADVNPYVTSDTVCLNGHTVNSLMVVDRMEWDIEVVRDVFNERDQEGILSIPLSATEQVDKLFWRFEESGNYSVKSAYRTLQNQKYNGRMEINDEAWKILWSIKAPPKTLNLVWRALTGTLPTMFQLQSKKVQVQLSCPICHQEDETIFHCLVQCQYAKQCWSILLPGTQFVEVSDFNSWFISMFGKVDRSKFAELVTLCWSLWRSRNDLVWNQKHTRVYMTVAAAKQYLAQWIITQNRNFVTPLQPQVEGDGAILWVKPQQNSIKVSVDAAVFVDHGGVGFGLVARNSAGVLCEAQAKFKSGLYSPLEAEAMAFKEALSWMDRRGWHEASIESDCLNMVQAVRSCVPMRSYYGRIIEECRSILHRLNKICLFFVKRSANMVAHQLARESYLLSGRTFDRFNVPTSIQACIDLDLNDE